MARIDVELKAFMQKEHVLGGPAGDSMDGQVSFDVVADGKRTPGCLVDVKLVVGGTYEVDAVEVGRPVGFRGAFNQARFAECVEKYVRSAVGSKGWAIRVGPGSSNVVMANNWFGRPENCSFEAAPDSGGW